MTVLILRARYDKSYLIFSFYGFIYHKIAYILIFYHALELL